MRRVFGVVFLVIVAAAISGSGYSYYRDKAMDHLYAEAAGYPPFFRGTAEAQAAVKKLSTYRGLRSTRMLLDIALGNVPFPWGDTQAEAIKALSERKDPDISTAMANLLQPHQSLSARQPAALALRDLPCKAESIRSILHYLERIWRGEPNYEDQLIDSTSDKERFASTLKKEQEEIYQNLYVVLQRERVETIRNLKLVYGIGSTTPSPFALDLLSRLGLHEACPLLLQSDQAIQQLTPEFLNAPRKELQATIRSLNCR